MAAGEAAFLSGSWVKIAAGWTLREIRWFLSRHTYSAKWGKEKKAALRVSLRLGDCNLKRAVEMGRTVSVSFLRVSTEGWVGIGGPEFFATGDGEGGDAGRLPRARMRRRGRGESAADGEWRTQ